MKTGQKTVDSTKAPHWEHFDHDADIGVRGHGPSLEIAFEQAALALTAVVTHDAVKAETAVEIDCDAPDPETLLVDWLNALVFEMATRSMLFSGFKATITQSNGWHLKAVARGEPVDRGRHNPAVEVKGATYTSLSVKRRDDGTWHAGCVLDV